MARALLVVLSLVLFAAVAAAEKLVVGLPDPGRVPFFRQDSPQRFSGTYVTLLERIGALAGVEIEFRMVPQARLILEFAQGMIDIEPGIAPSWRPSAAEAAISRYSLPFMTMDDVLICPPGKPCHRSDQWTICRNSKA